MNKDFYTIKEASKILDLTEQTIRNYMSSGSIKGEKVYYSTVISQKEIDRQLSMREEVIKGDK